MKIRGLQLDSEGCKDSKTVFVFVLTRMVSDFYSFKGEKNHILQEEK